MTLYAHRSSIPFTGSGYEITNAVLRRNAVSVPFGIPPDSISIPVGVLYQVKNQYVFGPLTNLFRLDLKMFIDGIKTH